MTTLDIRWPLGAIFSLVGAILLAYGTAKVPEDPAVGIDVAWGAVLLAFGVTMLLLARRAAVAHRLAALAHHG